MQSTHDPAIRSRHDYVSSFPISKEFPNFTFSNKPTASSSPKKQTTSDFFSLFQNTNSPKILTSGKNDLPATPIILPILHKTLPLNKHATSEGMNNHLYSAWEQQSVKKTWDFISFHSTHTPRCRDANKALMKTGKKPVIPHHHHIHHHHHEFVFTRGG